MRSTRRRRRLSMTSLIDVIFLLLLFFMLSSTFTRFAELDLTASAAGDPAEAARPAFLSLAPDSVRLNGADASLATLGVALDALRTGDSPLPVLVALQPEVDAQRLTDLLVALRALPRLRVTVLEAA